MKRNPCLKQRFIAYLNRKKQLTVQTYKPTTSVTPKPTTSVTLDKRTPKSMRSVTHPEHFLIFSLGKMVQSYSFSPYLFIICCYLSIKAHSKQNFVKGVKIAEPYINREMFRSNMFRSKFSNFW